MKFFSCIQNTLISQFERLGAFIAVYPKWFVMVSIMSTLVFGLGLLRFRLQTDFNYLSTPINCRAYAEIEAMEKLFPMNTSTDFSFLRMIHLGRLGSVIIVPKDGESVLRKRIFSEIMEIDKTIKSIQIIYADHEYNFSSLCARNLGSCQDNEILKYKNDINRIENKKLFIKFPINIDFELLNYNISAFNLGGVTTDENKNVLKAKALRLFYFLDYSNSFKDNLAAQWEREFLKVISQQKTENINISWFTSSTFDTEFWTFAIEGLKLGWITTLCVLAFCVLTSMTSDWVTSKPWLSISGVVSVGLAIVTSFGILSGCGLECTAVNVTVPFLLLGIGVDDAFVLIAAWRRTNPKDSVPIRMKNTYSEGAISITITSLTNVLAFCVGIIVPLPTIRIFCVYAAVGILIDYIYQITFFGGCMALTGYREEANLHPLTFKPMVSSKNISNKGRLYRFIFVQRESTMEATAPWLMIWCRDTIGEWLSKGWARIAIIFAFLVYLSVAGYGVTKLREGVEYNDIFLPSSYATPYVIAFYRYFMQYPHPVQVVINKTMDYSDSNIQNQVLDTFNKFKESPYVVGSWNISWLNTYLYFIREDRFWYYQRGYNFSNSEDFVECLRKVFLKTGVGKMFEEDILFAEDGIQITASRFVFVTSNIIDSETEKAMVMNIRSIADQAPLPIIVHNFWWITYEQFLLVKTLAVQSIVSAVVVITLVFILFTPHLPSVICVTASITSIEFGVIGYMALMNLRLDIMSVIVLIICIGICVDYSAHISYAYMIAKHNSPKERVKQALFFAGMPIIQACISTILSIIALLFIPSYTFIAFTRIIVLIVFLALVHGLFILPTFLYQWDCICIAHQKRKTEIQNLQNIKELECLTTVKNISETEPISDGK